MEKPILSVHTQIKLQEERILHPVVWCRERVEYQLVGFSQPVVKVIDTRPTSIQAMARKHETGQQEDFLPAFNLPARMRLWAVYPREIRIELSETVQKAPGYIFWIAREPQLPKPLYPFLFRHSTHLEDGGYLHFSIFQVLQAQETRMRIFSTAA